MNDNRPDVSIVLPLVDHRGKAFDSISSFLAQTIASSRYELIVASDQSDPQLETEVSRRFPSVKLVRKAGLNVSALYNLGCQRASGDYLLLSETHCVAKPTCVENVLNYARREGLACAGCGTSGAQASAIARGTQRIVDEDLNQLRRSGESTVTIRGFLIERALWKALGGFQSEFGQFSEVMLTRDIHAQGIRIGFAADALVHHHDQSSVRILCRELIRYGEGESRANHHAQRTETSFPSEDWLTFQREHRDRKLASRRLFLLRRKLAIYQAGLTLTSWLPETHFRLFVKFWRTAIRVGRLQYIVAMSTSDNLTPMHLHAEHSAHQSS